MRMILRIIILVLVCMLIAAITARGQGVSNPVIGEDVKPCGEVGIGLDFYSLEKEITLGKSLATEVERQTKLLNDPVITEYVNRVGQNIVRNSDAKVPFTIKVIDSNEVNAFALPGGFFFVNVGLVLKADGEAELAGVMAHEIGHVADRHGTKPGDAGGACSDRDHSLDLFGRYRGTRGAERHIASRAYELPEILPPVRRESGLSRSHLHVSHRLRSERARSPCLSVSNRRRRKSPGR